MTRVPRRRPFIGARSASTWLQSSPWRGAVRNHEGAGVPRSVAMKLTGHVTESVNRRYAIGDDRDLRVAVERLDSAQALG